MPPDTPPPERARKPRQLRPALLGRADAAAFLAISASTLDRLSAAGEVPAPMKMGGRVVWSRAELTAWTRHGCPARSSWIAIWKQLRDRAARRQ